MTEIITPVLIGTRDLPTDLVFTEGKQVRVEHVRIERRRLRKTYFELMAEPHLCDVLES